MKVYLASSFALVHTVKKIANSLKRCGHEVTQEWWHFDYKTIGKSDDKSWYELSQVREISDKNFKGIENADCLLLIANPKVAQKFNGANIELGYALALKKPCYSIGKLQRSAMYVPVVQCENLRQFLEVENHE